MGSVVQQFRQVSDGYIRSDGDFFQCHARGEETFDDRFHLFADFDDMSVRVVEADDALSPALFGDRAQPVDAGKSYQYLQKTVEVGFL